MSVASKDRKAKTDAQQRAAFIATARELGADESVEAFEDKLKRIANVPTKARRARMLIRRASPPKPKHKK